MKHWYVLHTKPHKERQVAEHLRGLQGRNVEVYMPIVPAPRVNPRAARERPYFPCYLFARADLDEIGTSACNGLRLRRLVELGQPAVVPTTSCSRSNAAWITSAKRAVDSTVCKRASKDHQPSFAGCEDF